MLMMINRIAFSSRYFCLIDQTIFVFLVTVKCNSGFFLVNSGRFRKAFCVGERKRQNDLIDKMTEDEDINGLIQSLHNVVENNLHIESSQRRKRFISCYFSCG